VKIDREENKRFFEEKLAELSKEEAAFYAKDLEVVKNEWGLSSEVLCCFQAFYPKVEGKDALEKFAAAWDWAVDEWIK
jgi:hypothetical protein